VRYNAINQAHLLKLWGAEIARPDNAAPDMCTKFFQKKTNKVQQLLPQFAST